MPVKINGSSSGSVTLAAPASGSDVSLTLPTTAIATESFATSAASSAVAPMGLVAVAPTSIANSGGSASLSDYTVSFSGVSSVSLNGVFSGDYDNYRVVLSISDASAGGNTYFRVRASSSDLTTSYYYGFRYTNFGGSGGDSVGSNAGYVLLTYAPTGATSASADIIAPYLAQKTTIHFHGINTETAGNSRSGSGMVNNSTAYDGFTIYPASGTITGTISVYGYRP